MLVATGVSYRRLEAPGLDELTGRGVYYGATASEASQCEGDDVYIVGAANSAGQAALNLARYAKRVVLVVRGGDARGHDVAVPRRADHRARPTSRCGSAARSSACRGDDHLEALTLADRDTGADEDVPTSWLFVFIGAVAAHRLARRRRRPRRQGVRRHRPGPARRRARAARGRWPVPPFALETSVPGVFAAGDVRLDSMKRVASAVGEGAMSVYLVHRYLATSDAASTTCARSRSSTV